MGCRPWAWHRAKMSRSHSLSIDRGVHFYVRNAGSPSDYSLVAAGAEQQAWRQVRAKVAEADARIAVADSSRAEVAALREQMRTHVEARIANCQTGTFSYGRTRLPFLVAWSLAGPAMQRVPSAASGFPFLLRGAWRALRYGGSPRPAPWAHRALGRSQYSTSTAALPGHSPGVRV